MTQTDNPNTGHAPVYVRPGFLVEQAATNGDTLDPHWKLRRLARDAIDLWQSRLRLSDWDIVLTIGPCEDEHMVESESNWRHKQAKIRFPENYFTRSIEKNLYDHEESPERRVAFSVIHELLHILEEPLISQLDRELVWAVGKEGYMGDPTRTLWRDYREWWINQMTRVLLEQRPEA